MELTLAPNPLHQQPQTISLSKVTTLIGENGSGKSSILQSIFSQKLTQKKYIDKKIVCFSSGQNEKFSNEFLRHIKKTNANENNLQFSCFYFDKSWSKLLIFLATALKKGGKVREFLTSAGYADEVEGLDDTTTLKIAFRLDSQYVRQVDEALNREARGDIDTIRQTAFHRTLESFIENCIRDKYDFDVPIKKDIFEIYPENLLEVSFDTERLEDGEDLVSRFDPEIGFFIRASHNSSFLDKEASSLIFKNKNDDNPIELGDLSDGEFQLLFLYAIIDLFDSSDTLFIFDEADSHLHFANVKKFWDSLKKIKGNTISTTHLLDSIYCVGVENVRILNKGKVHLPSESNELINRLSQLSNIKKSEFRALTYYKKIVLIDDLNDWYIFRELYKKSKQAFGVPNEYFDELFDQVAVVKVNSGWNTHNCKFAESKLGWVQNFMKFCEGLDIKTTEIFLLCDRDNLPIDGIGTEEFSLKVQGIKVNTGNALKVHVLSWRRREIKHYLLSNSALGECVAALNNHNLPESAHLQQFHNGDYLLEKCDNHFNVLHETREIKKGKESNFEAKPVYNNYLASLPSDFVKNILSPFIEEVEEEPYGFNIEMFQEYISHIAPTEISEDITNMYNFIIGKL
ncbi:AAA family ATPase [Catenovulum sp. SX2]|uniref:AAA family ATPase n=1 Tax=Catenovulum sp. SX2 TaxID=3398614 RepID=UPI003F8718E2